MNQFDQLSRHSSKYSQQPFNAAQLTQILTDEDFAQNLPKDVLEAMKNGNLDQAMEKLREKVQDDEKLGNLVNQWLKEQASSIFRGMTHPARFLFSLFKQMLVKSQKKTNKTESSELKNQLSKQLKEEQIRKEIAKLNEQKMQLAEKNKVMISLKNIRNVFGYSLGLMASLMKSLKNTVALNKQKSQLLQKKAVRPESKIALFVKGVQINLKNLQESFMNAFAKSVLKPFQSAEKKLQQGFESISKLASRLGEGLKMGIKQLRLLFQTPVMIKNAGQKLSAMSDRLKTNFNQFNQKIAENMKTLAQAFDPTRHTQAFSNQVKNALEYGQQKVSSAVQSVQHQASAAVQMVAMAATFVSTPMVNLFAKTKNNADAFTKKGIRRLTGQSKQFYQECKKKFFQAAASSMRQCQEMLKNALISLGLAVYEIVRLLRDICLDWFKSLKIGLKNMARAAVRFILLAMPILWKGVKALPGVFKRLMMRGAAGLRKALIRALRRMQSNAKAN